MARPSKPIPPKAREAWERGDEPAAEKLSGLRSRQLRNRLGPPGRGSGPATGSAAAQATPAPVPQKLVRKALDRQRARAIAMLDANTVPSSEPEPTLEQIDRVDTREEAEAIYRDVRAKMRTADDVRYGSLAEKALAAINRIEQIDKNRPRPQAPDEVVRRLVEVKGRAVERFGILAREAVKGATA